MGIFDALTTAVAGLQAQSFALQNISGNISNAETTSYKGTDTAFADMVTNAAAASEQQAGGVIASSVATNDVQGSIETESVSTDMAINGAGYFVVSDPSSFSDNQPVFSGVDDYTRRGDFQLNNNGYLVNGAGYYLMGIPVDATTGNPVGSVPQVLQFDNNFLPAQATTQINYQANLASFPLTADAQSGVAGSELLDPTGFIADPLTGAPTAAKITGTGADLSPDAAAKGTGTVTTLSPGTTMASLGLTAGQTVTVSDGTNTDTYTVANGDTVATFLAAINGGTADVSAAIVPSGGPGSIVLTGTNDLASITVGGTPAASAALGFGAGQNSFEPTNLLTQSAVSAGQTLTITTSNGGSPITKTITFGTSGSQVATLGELQTALQGLTNVNATVDTANGNVTISALNSTDQITVGGTASAAKFGLQNLLAVPADGTVIADDNQTFINESIAGGSVTAYDSTGNPVNIQFRWAKTASTQTGGTDTWQLFYQTNSSATGTEAEWQNAGTNFTFNANGQLSPPVSGLTLSNLTVGGDSLGNVQVVFGSNGLTQFADSSGTANVSTLTQNGFAAGKLQSVSVDSENRVVGTFSNGQTVPLAQISLANFNGQNSLQALDGGAYAATAESGGPLFSTTGQIVGSSLEASNVDIASQFSQLIVAQQAYSANAKVMTTADQMIQSLLTVIQ